MSDTIHDLPIFGGPAMILVPSGIIPQRTNGRCKFLGVEFRAGKNSHATPQFELYNLAKLSRKEIDDVDGRG